MKRLLGLLGLTCLLVLTACFYLGESVAIILGIGTFLLFSVSMLIPFARKEGTYPVAFITAFITVCVFFGYLNFFVTPLRRFDDCNVQIIATKEDEYFQNGYYNYVLKVKTIDGEDINSKLLLLSKYPCISQYGDEFSFTTDVSFNENKTFWSRRIFLRSFMYEEGNVVITKPEKRGFLYHFKNLNNKLSTALYLEMDYEEASFSSAVLLGNKYDLSPEVKELLRESGLSHIAVVSGLHISIIAAMVEKFFGKLFKNKILKGCLTIVSILAFALLCGFGVPVIRASVMLIILNIGKMIDRRSDSVNSIGLAALILIIVNPFCVGDVGMLLSFAATLGIVFWADKLSIPVINKLSPLPVIRINFINKLMRIALNTVSMSLCATLWTLPITIFVFGGVSTVSLICNLLIVPFMWIVLVAILLLTVTHYVEFLSVMCDWLSGFVTLFYNYLICICEVVTSLPHSYVYTNKSYFYIWVALTFIIAAFALVLNKRSATVISVLLSALILFTGSLNYNIDRDQRLTVHIMDSGNALSVLLESSDGHAVLRASGSNLKTYIVEEKIEAMGRFSSSVYVDVYGRNSNIFYTNITNRFDYGRIIRYDNIAVNSNNDNCDIISFSKFHCLDLWSKAKVYMICENENVFEYIDTGEMSVLIAPRDADCSLIPANYTYADIVITDGLPYNYNLLKFDKVYITGESYASQVAEEKFNLLCKNVIRVKECSFDLDV